MTSTFGRAGKNIFSPVPSGNSKDEHINYHLSLDPDTDSTSASSRNSVHHQYTRSEELTDHLDSISGRNEQKSGGNNITHNRNKSEIAFGRFSNDAQDSMDTFGVKLSPRSNMSSPRTGRTSTSSRTFTLKHSASEDASTKHTLLFPRHVGNNNATENSDNALTIDTQSISPLSNSTSAVDHGRDREKEELLATLEVLKMQNKMLTNRIEKTQVESLSQIEKERLQRKQLVANYEHENELLKQQLLEAKTASEQQLEREKHEFLQKLKNMETEKSNLEYKLHSLQEESYNENNLLRMQRSEMIDNIQKLEYDKQSLEEKLIKNQLQTENTTIEISQQLINERNELQNILNKLEQDKHILTLTLQETEAKVSENEKNFQIQLETEKLAMTEHIQNMETEKNQLFEKLKTTELTAQQTSIAMQLQIDKEQRETQAAIEALERDKLVLAKQIAEHEQLTQLSAKLNASTPQVITPRKSSNAESGSTHSTLSESTQSVSNSTSSAHTTTTSTPTTPLRFSRHGGGAASGGGSSSVITANGDSAVPIADVNVVTSTALNDETRNGSNKLTNTNNALTSPESTPMRFSRHSTTAKSTTTGTTSITAAAPNTSPLPAPAMSADMLALLAEKELMQQQLQQINREKEELQKKLSDSQSAQTAQNIQKQHAKKLQLKRSVLKMKEELDLERKLRADSICESPDISEKIGITDVLAESSTRPETITSAPPSVNTSKFTPLQFSRKPLFPNAGKKLSTNAQNATFTSSPHATQHKVLISAKRSLFDVLETSNVNSGNNSVSGMETYDILSTSSHSPDSSSHSLHSVTNTHNTNSTANNAYNRIHLTRRSIANNFTAHAVEKIDEGDEDKLNFMDADSDDESKGGTASRKHTKSNEVVDHGPKPAQSLEEIEAELIAGLPAPHSAAALGNMKRIRHLYGLDADLLKSLDSCGRKPLFYAAAYGRLEAIEYLVTNYPENVLDGDIHFDTALHAATSSGHAECANLLIRAAGGTKEAAEPRNSMDMTPAHLASTADCLEILYKYEADICALDSHQRSPLFVACAMNREDCTEYLVNCLDHTESLLLLKDKRGDTPLHAAACNGSIECLLLLLQYGIDPRMTNDLGLKAVDLAIRNSHQKCRDILAEYHLHYCTSSEFDSVLFLATLEGHRMIAEQKINNVIPVAVDNTYQILRKTSAQSLTINTMTPHVTRVSPTNIDLSADKTKSLSKATQSMFSLRAVKSLRLERWGAWIAYHDQSSNTVFWYNHEANTGQWDKPEQVTLMQLNSREKKDIFEKTLQAKASMRLMKVGDWIKYVTEAGKTFYYNEKTNDFQWDDPTGTGHVTKSRKAKEGLSPSTKARALAASASISSPTASDADKTHSFNSDIYSNEYHHTEDGVEQHVEVEVEECNTNQEGYGTEHPEHDPNAPWRPYRDEESDSIFWYNHVTHVSQWECPYDNTGTGSGVNGKKRHSIDDHDVHEVVTVSHEDDLGLGF